MDPDVVPSPVLIGESSLHRWEVIGSGGFGQIFKARHRHWVWDVAIKFLHYDNGSCSDLLREAELMRRGESPYVVRVSGVFRGRLPCSGPSVHLGLVMDYMEQGSLADLQGMLCGPPPWPLAFRFPYQIALGVNFLHNLSPPVLHLDLKPSNVLLDSGLNVKLTDFGLSRIYQSVSRGSKVGSLEEGGTTSYMPPEAFRMNYKPTCASDMYSYGILLWSILTGQKPYSNAFSSLVRLRIPEGDRPTLEEIDLSQADGLGPLVELLVRCWDAVPQQRPCFLECISVTEKQYDIHKSGIHGAVHETQAMLEKKRQERKLSDGLTKLQITTPSTSLHTPMDNITGPPPVQETCVPIMKNQSADSGRDTYSSQTMSSVTMTNMEAESSVKLSHSSESDPPPVAAEHATASKVAEKPAQATFRPTVPGAYQRQLSSPECVPVYINRSNVKWFLNGNGNHMHVCTPEVSADRRRHPTAPSRVSTTPPSSQSHRRTDTEH